MDYFHISYSHLCHARQLGATVGRPSGLWPSVCLETPPTWRFATPSSAPAVGASSGRWPWSRGPTQPWWLTALRLLPSDAVGYCAAMSACEKGFEWRRALALPGGPECWPWPLVPGFMRCRRATWSPTLSRTTRCPAGDAFSKWIARNP